MTNSEHYCAIGNFIMSLFQNHIDNLNKTEAASLDYKEIKNFKEKKATQAELARLLGDDKTFSKTTLSGYITGASPVPLETVLKLNERLHLKSDSFLKLVELFVRQSPVFSTALLPEENGSAMKEAAAQINSIFINTITLKILFEISKSQYPEDIEIQFRHDLHNKLKEITNKIVSMYARNNTEIKEIAKLVLGAKEG